MWSEGEMGIKKRYLSKFANLRILRVFFALEIFLIALLSIKLSEIEGYLSYLILIICLVLLAYAIYKVRNSMKTDRKKPINLNFNKIIKIKYITLLIAILLFFLSPIWLPPLLKCYIVEEYTQSETAKNDLHRLTSEITRGYSDDANKTKTILRWFDRDSGNINNVYGKKHLLLKIYPLHVYTSKPYICIRLIKHENPLWVLKSRCGACEEYAMLFMEMANAANLTVRSIYNHGEDHNWDEILINGKWIVVDPSIVNLSENETGFNVTQMLNERWWNISHTRALYPNGTIEDVTYRYTNLSNLTIIALDENKTPVSNVSIRVLSHNRQDEKGNIGIDTEINRTTDPEGRCEIKIGGGNYTIIGEKKEDGSHLSAKTTIALLENENNSTQLILKKDCLWWLQYLPSSLRSMFLVLCSLSLWVFIVLYIEPSNGICRVNENMLE